MATVPKLDVLDGSGVDTLLEELLRKLPSKYVTKASYEAKIAELEERLANASFTNPDAWVNNLTSVYIDENGHLIVSYAGNDTPAMEIDDNGHLIVTYAGATAPDMSITEEGHLIVGSAA
jgi:hypothetical protein